MSSWCRNEVGFQGSLFEAFCVSGVVVCAGARAGLHAFGVGELFCVGGWWWALGPAFASILGKLVASIWECFVCAYSGCFVKIYFK